MKSDDGNKKENRMYVVIRRPLECLGSNSVHFVDCI